VSFHHAVKIHSFGSDYVLMLSSIGKAFTDFLSHVKAHSSAQPNSKGEKRSRDQINE
jgi:hypothetical protein